MEVEAFFWEYKSIFLYSSLSILLSLKGWEVEGSGRGFGERMACHVLPCWT